MAITLDEATNTIKRFNKTYPIAQRLHFYLGNTPTELYGNTKLKVAYLKAAYLPYREPNNGYFGRVDIILNHTDNANDLTTSLNHEILGHYGLNTFNPQEKKILLDNIIKHKDNLKDLWDYVEKHYPNEHRYLKAEEVYCHLAEQVSPEQHLGKNIKQLGESNFKNINYFNLKPLDEESLRSIVLMVADGISDRSREQQTFPHNDLTFIQPYFRQAQEPELIQAPELER